MNKQKSNNVFLALFLSFIVTLLGGLIFGLIYYIGYYVFLLCLVEIYLASLVYMKQIHNKSGKHIAFAIIWTVFWTFIANVFAVIICEALVITKQWNYSFIDSLKTVLYLFQTDAEVKKYLTIRMLQIAGMIALGGVVYLCSYLVQRAKNKKNKRSSKQAEKYEVTNKKSLTNSHSQKAKDNFHSLFTATKRALETLAQTKDKKSFNNTITKEIKSKTEKLEINEKNQILKQISADIDRENITKIELKANEILLKLLK